MSFNGKLEILRYLFDKIKPISEDSVTRQVVEKPLSFNDFTPSLSPNEAEVLDGALLI